MTISIIVPTYNESNQISHFFDAILNGVTENVIELLIIDSANSTDNLRELTEKSGFSYVKSACCSRATQMNFGANLAKGDVFYFVHADTLLPSTYVADIQKMLENSDLGCFRAKIESRNLLLKINSFFTRFDFLWCRGGDQTLFVKRDVFKQIGGFDEQFVIMEEYDFMRKAQSKFRFGIIPKSVSVSARKYEVNSFWKIQRANLIAMRMFMKGKSTPKQIKDKYTSLLSLKY